MKGKRQISPAVITSLVLVAMLLVVGVIGFVSRGGQGDATLVGDGPNAGLSNEELLSKAMANTNVKAVRSVHAEVSGYFFYYDSDRQRYFLDSFKDMRIVADLQSAKNQGRIAISPRGSTTPAEAHTILMASDGKTYESADGGRTWALHVEVSGGFMMALLPPLTMFWQDGTWGSILSEVGQQDEAEGEGTPVPGEGRESPAFPFRDAAPRLEKLDGVITRHLVLEPRATGGHLLLPGMDTFSIWVSTDMTPTLRQVVIRGTVDQATIDQASSTGIMKAGPYTSTWKWSRFNEDFGEVKPPAADTIKQP